MHDSDNSGGRKTEPSFWAWEAPVRLRLPSTLRIDVLNTTRLLKKHVRPGDRYVEIGCAPGKLLAWVASVLHAEAAGLDYSAAGITQCRRLFSALNLDIALYHEDLFSNTLPGGSFDVAASFGFIEHFDDPAPAILQHLRLLKPGGLALITVPNYTGIYGKLQKWCDPQSLELHNLNIMHPTALHALAASLTVESIRCYRYGRVGAGLISLQKKLPVAVSTLLQLATNAIGLLQPALVPALAPQLVLEVRTRR